MMARCFTTLSKSGKDSQRNFDLANGLTFLRIAIIPLLMILLFFPGKVCTLLAALLFSLAALTDQIDGFIARKRNTVTTLGRFLDPLADKLLVIIPLIMLIPLGRVPAWMVVIIVAREIIITGLRSMAAFDGVIITPTTLAKHKTLFQYIALIFLIFHYRYWVDFHKVGIFFLWFALVITVWSGIDYLIKFLRGNFGAKSQTNHPV